MKVSKRAHDNLGNVNELSPLVNSEEALKTMKSTGSSFQRAQLTLQGETEFGQRTRRGWKLSSPRSLLLLPKPSFLTRRRQSH